MVHFAGLEVEAHPLDLVEVGAGDPDEAGIVRIVDRMNLAVLIDAGVTRRQPIFLHRLELGVLGVAAILGFRMSARIDDGELTRLAEAEGVRVDGAVISKNGRTAFARLSDGRVMVARVMGADVSARFAPAKTVKLDVKSDRLNATFADTGFPPLKMRLDEQPAWLKEFSGGGGSST